MSPFCAYISPRFVGGMPGASSLKIALLEIRVRVGTASVAPRLRTFHTAPDSLPGVTADLVRNRSELSHH